MTHKLALQIALMMLVSSCIVIVMLAINSSLGNPATPDLGQVLPLAITCAAALLVIIANPFESRA
jgi:hypothetical protein